MTNLERHRTDLKALIDEAHTMRLDLMIALANEETKVTLDEAVVKSVSGKFQSEYQKWYTKSCALLAQLLPSRLEEFSSYYFPDPKRKVIDGQNFAIQDWILGTRSKRDYKGDKYFEDGVVLQKFRIQVEIIEATEQRFENSLFEIRQLLRADLFDSELGAAEELLQQRFLRGAGAIAGVVLEKHLGQVASAHKIVLKKLRPTISTFNDALKDASVIDVPTWRFIQHLGDLRNLCDHSKSKEPTEAEISDLIQGTKKISKTVF